MKILIIGSEGFIGSNLVTYFISLGLNVYGCDLLELPAFQKYTYTKIIRQVPQWNDIFSDNPFDYCINASGSGNISLSITDPLADFELNTLDTARILDAIRKHCSNCRYLHISSAAVYGNPAKLPVTESAICNPLSPYGWHKLMAEQACKEYSSIYGLQIVIARPFSVYGPGLMKQLFWDVFIKYKENKTEISMWGTGKESRDFIYIDDLARAFHLILEKGDMGSGIYNIASGNEITIEETMQLFFKSYDENCAVQFNGNSRVGDPLNWRADIEKIRQLGFTPSVKLQEGIGKLVHWMKNYEGEN